ncbi:MAG: hypothetical protein Phog2KO_21030 [Phototrophicaceae bacterium]
MNEKPKNQPLSLKTIGVVFLGSALIAGAIIFVALYFLLKPEPLQPYYLEGNPEGVRELSQARDVLDFTLPSTLGTEVSLSDFRGQSVVLFFGYTHCPDVCMITMSDVRRVEDLLGDDSGSVQFIFVSVDGERDTPERLSEFLVPFGLTEAVIGLQGEDVVLQRLRPDYSLFYQLNTDEGDNYTVDHTASLYLINPEGQLSTIFAYGTRPDIIAEHILTD